MMNEKVMKKARGYGYVDLFDTCDTIEEGFDFLKGVLKDKYTDKLLIITAYQRIINKLALSLATIMIETQH